MSAVMHQLAFSGALLRRGFWLYVWEITAADGRTVLYVGRTGDSGSPNAQSPFNRLGQHLGFNPLQNMLRKHLEKAGISPEECHFSLFSYGPILPEGDGWDEHRAGLAIIAPLEKALGEELHKAGYDVLNVVKCRKTLDLVHWAVVRAAFAAWFPQLQVDECSATR